LNKYVLEVSQNQWEYTGTVIINCNQLTKDFESDNIVYADGVKIEFDEEVGRVTKAVSLNNATR